VKYKNRQTNDLVADGYAIHLDGVSTLGDDMKNQH